jgi:ABC-type dipeptide/oligopeptide/nickel transport system permease subunit
MVGLSIVVFFILVAIFGPLLLHTDPNAFSPDTLQPPSAAHWLGTTQTGQDIFTQLVYGARTTIFWGLLTGLLVTILSIAVGLTGGYFGGGIDEGLSLLTNVFLVLPALPLAILLANFIGTANYVILVEVTLEFIGLGDPTVVSWGSMFFWAQNNSALLQGAWWWFVPPGLCVAAFGASLAFINFGRDEIANPRLRREPKPKALKVKKAVA